MSNRIFVRPFSKNITALSAWELSFIAGQLCFILEAGIPVSRGMGMIKPRKRASRLGKLLQETELSMLKGESLWSAFDNTGVFPNFFTYMTQVGEESGMLRDIMQQLEDYYAKEASISDGLKSAMLYPIIISTLMLSVIIISMLMVVPNYAKIFEANGVVLPLATAVLISLSEFILRRGNIIAVTVPILMLCVRCALHTECGMLWKYRLLLYSKLHVKDVNRKFTQALGILLVSGNDLVRSATISKNVIDNRIMQARLQHAIDRMVRGSALSSALEQEGGFDEMLITMIKLGEETGRLPSTVAKCAGYIQRELDVQITRMNKLVEPAITLALGLMLAFVMLAIMMPTFRLANIL